MRIRFFARDQRGVALPLVMAVAALTLILVTAALAHTQRSRLSADMSWKVVRAQYAAESGIARVQRQLQRDPSWRGTLLTRLNGMTATTRVEGRDAGGIRLSSVARGDGVQQTIRVVLDPERLTIREWRR